MKFVAFIFAFFSVILAMAQDDFEEERLNQILKSSINEFREANDLPLYQAVEELDAVAFDQAAYLMDQSRLLHTQENKKKETLKDRLIYFGAFYSEAGENLAEVSVGAKATIDKSGKKEIIQTEEQAIKAAIQFWMDGGDSELNLGDPLFKHFGSAVVKEDDRLILAVVMAGLPYTFPDGKQLEKVKTKLKAFDQSLCKELIDNHGTIPQLFSDAFKVEENEIYFEFHSLATVDAILSDAADGIAVEVVGDYQFECKEPNRLFPGDLQKGYLLPVSKKGKFNLLNEAKEKGAVRLKLADLPTEFRNIPIELNGFVLKDNHICFSIPFNQVEVDNRKDWDLPYLYAGKTEEEHFSWQDTLVKQFQLKEESNFLADSIYSELMDYAEVLKFDTYALKVELKISPTADVKNWDVFRKNLLSKLNALLDSTLIEDEVVVQTKALDQYLANTVYAIEAKELSGDNLKKYLSSEAENDSSLALFLKGLNRLEVQLIGEAKIDAEQDGSAKLQMLDRLVENRKIEQALPLQYDLIQNNPEVHEQLLNQMYNQEPDFIELINNQIALSAEKGKTEFKGNPLHLAFLEIFLVAKPTIVSYNKLLAEVKHWAQNPAKARGVDTWDKDFNRLRSSDLISREVFARTAINFYIIAADYYYEKNEFSARRKAFDQLMKFVQLADLSQNEKIELAQMLCYQDQFDRAINLLLPEVKKEEASAELLSYFLQIAIYEMDEVGDELYLNLMERLSKKDTEVFCEFFSKEKRGIQALSDYSVKEMYCESCESGANGH
ncbi:MAG: CAP domain-containing protein [Vicingaceae bacterium]